MAEIRKHNPTTSDIGEQVRALLGETIRPVTPGDQAHNPEDDMYDPFADSGADSDDAPDNIVSFVAGGAPLIGVLPEGFNAWVFEDDDPAA